MYVYKITDNKSDNVYIGIDTKPKEKLLRWKAHLRNARYVIKNNKKTTKFYKQLGVRPEDFSVEVVFESDSIYELLQAEIRTITEHNSFHEGYNSTRGGECFKSIIKSDVHYHELYKIFKERMLEYNNEKWRDKSVEEKRAMMNMHTDASNQKRSETIKREWAAMDQHQKSKKLNGLLTYIDANKEQYKKNAKLASDIAASKSSIAIILKNKVSGEVFRFTSLKEVYRTLGVSGQHLQNLKKNGKNGTKTWEIVNECDI